MAIYPLNLSFDCAVTCDDLRDALRALDRAVATVPYLVIAAWSIPAEGERVEPSLRAALDALGEGTPSNAGFKLDDGSQGFVYRSRSTESGFAVKIDKSARGRAPHEITGFLVGMAELSASLARTSRLTKVSLVREAGGVLAIPRVPLVRSNSHLTWVSAEEVRAAYERPDGFWPGWDRLAQEGDRCLLGRGLDLATDPEYFERIQPHQWRMARAAKPGLTEYFAPQREPEEEAIFREGGPYLEEVGYVEDDRLVEFSCVLPPGTHLPGWEIYQVRKLARGIELQGGRQVEGVRVVFLDRWAAEQEKRPLLDVGAQVFYYGDDGELIEVE